MCNRHVTTALFCRFVLSSPRVSPLPGVAPEFTPVRSLQLGICGGDGAQEGLEPPTYALRSKELYRFYISNCMIFYSIFQLIAKVDAVKIMFLRRINVKTRTGVRSRDLETVTTA
jgi:hypothetical protein